MPSLIDMRRRIRSVKNTQQITKAMKMVSAAKLRRAQSRVVASRPYGSLLRKVLANVAAAVPGIGDGEESIRCSRGARKRASCWWSSQRQGSGRSLQRQPRQGRATLHEGAPDATVQLELIGRKGRDFFRKRRAAISGEHVGLAAKAAYADTAAIARKAADLYRNREIDAVYLLYNESRAWVPRSSPWSACSRSRCRTMPLLWTTSSILRPLKCWRTCFPVYVEVEFYRALLESTAPSMPRA